MDVKVLKKHLVAWLKKQVKAAGAKGLVVGLSGGIDSAVVAALAKLGCGKNTMGLIMPCCSQSEDEGYARQAAKAISIRTAKLQLDPVFNAFEKILPAAKDRMAKSNIKPRLRMITLYYHATLNNYLVAGTGNKTELELGYFTKYGDGGVDLLPLGDLVKKEVRMLAKALNVPQEIIDRPPTAGLWPGQTDEGEIGLLYDELDALVIGQKPPYKISKEKIDKVKRMRLASAHKRALPPTFYKNRK